jgi:hypothetical protein
MKHRKLRIAWSAAWGIMAIWAIVLWTHTLRNQVKAATWVSKSHYIRFVAFRHWMTFTAGRPDWEPPGYLHSIPVVDPGPRTSPEHKWYAGRLVRTGIPTGIEITCPLWVPLMLWAALATAPWTSSIRNLRRFSLRTLLIATTLVAIALGLIVWAAK